MSTIGYENWAVDLAEVGAIYPFRGSEGLMVTLLVVAWLGWHVWQMRAENAALKKKQSKEKSKRSIDRY